MINMNLVYLERYVLALSTKEMQPRESKHYVDMPKYLCVKIRKACWRQHRPLCCRFAHKAIQESVDERREFWFSIPSDRWVLKSILFMLNSFISPKLFFLDVQ